jgi:hypothetical protein
MDDLSKRDANSYLPPERLAAHQAHEVTVLRARIEELERNLAAAQEREARLREALQTMIYETTHLSPEEDDGSHWCKISRDALSAARAALKGETP